MPCEPASRTLPSWDLANLREVSQIQLFSLKRHQERTSPRLGIWTPLLYTLWCRTTSGTVWTDRLGVLGSNNLFWETIVWLYEIYVYNWQRILPSLVLSDPHTSRHNSSQKEGRITTLLGRKSWGVVIWWRALWDFIPETSGVEDYKDSGLQN